MKEFVDISLFASITERIWSVGEANLTPAERELLAVELLLGQLLQNGLPGAVAALSRESLETALAGLRRIRADSAANLLERTLAIPLHQLKKDEDPDVEAVEREWAGLETNTPTTDLATAYAQTHPDEFPGPWSLEELWISMQRRGELQKPKKLKEMESHAASDSRFPHQICPICGQPIPLRRKSCRRCGRAAPQG